MIVVVLFKMTIGPIILIVEKVFMGKTKEDNEYDGGDPLSCFIFCYRCCQVEGWQRTSDFENVLGGSSMNIVKVSNYHATCFAYNSGAHGSSGCCRRINSFPLIKKSKHFVMHKEICVAKASLNWYYNDILTGADKRRQNKQPKDRPASGPYERKICLVPQWHCNDIHRVQRNTISHSGRRGHRRGHGIPWQG